MSQKINDGLTAQQRYDLRHPDRRQEIQQRWIENHPGRKQFLARKRYHANLQKSRKVQREKLKLYRQRHPDCVKLQAQKYYPKRRIRVTSSPFLMERERNQCRKFYRLHLTEQRNRCRKKAMIESTNLTTNYLKQRIRNEFGLFNIPDTFIQLTRVKIQLLRKRKELYGPSSHSKSY
jgi:hypothetical protein